jgi:hypothetical protein
VSTPTLLARVKLQRHVGALCYYCQLHNVTSDTICMLVGQYRYNNLHARPKPRHTRRESSSSFWLVAQIGSPLYEGSDKCSYATGRQTRAESGDRRRGLLPLISTTRTTQRKNRSCTAMSPGAAKHMLRRTANGRPVLPHQTVGACLLCPAAAADAHRLAWCAVGFRFSAF